MVNILNAFLKYALQVKGQSVYVSLGQLGSVWVSWGQVGPSGCQVDTHFGQVGSRGTKGDKVGSRGTKRGQEVWYFCG